MEYRKIIGFGKSSYVVSLPKAWMTDKKLKKGDIVYVDQDGDRLLLYPAENKEGNEIKKATMDVTGMTKQEIRLQLVSKYIQNFNEITLISENMKANAKDVRSIVHDLMALEVVEETSSKIVTKDFLNMEDIIPSNLMNKMDLITREMLADSKGAFEEDKSFNIEERDFDVNRLLYLLYRAVRYFQRNPAAARKKGLTPEELMLVWFAATKVERIADQVKRIARLIRRVKFRESEQEELAALYSSIERYYIESLSVFYKKDTEKAFRLCTQGKRLIKQCKDFYRQNWNYESVPLIVEKLNSIVADTRSLLTYMCDIT
jgi:phosphate transport system protein